MNKITLTEIWIYPIKSLPGIRVSTGLVKQKGMEGDRRYMLIDENNRFMTQRQLPQMSQFILLADGKTIDVGHKSSTSLGSISIAASEQSAENISATIWDDVVEVKEVSPRYSSWFSDALSMRCKFVRFPELNKRRANPKYVQEEYDVSLADAYPYLIIGRNSLRDLNARVSTEMSMRRFRPNLVFEGGKPFEEDTWRKFRVGDVQFEGVKGCDRCVLTTVDPVTGLKGDEPLLTLSTFRKRDGKVYFGQNVVAHNQGEINEGDEITFQ